MASRMIVPLLMIVVYNSPVISGFSPPSHCDTCTKSMTSTHVNISEQDVTSHHRATMSLSMGNNPFSDFFSFIPFGDNNDDEKNSDNKNDKVEDGTEGSTMKYEGGDDGVIDSPEEIATTEIFHLPAKKIKIGGLRLYLSLYFMGECNTPTRRTWRADQTPDGGIDLYFRDRTGALILAFNDSGMSVSRLGSAPSMEYVMQESVMLRGMLNQLDEITGDDKIGEGDQLLSLVEPGDAIEKVRENLAFE